MCSFACRPVHVNPFDLHLSTYYGTSQSHDFYLEVMGELKGFIDTQDFDKVVIAGDFNADFNHRGTTSEYLLNLMNDFQLCTVDLLPCYNVDFTYERDDGLACSWPDHILINRHCINDISSVMCIASSPGPFPAFQFHFSMEIWTVAGFNHKVCN